MGDIILAEGGRNGCDLGSGWRKSSYSLSNGHCVEVSRLDGGVGVRDSKNMNGPVLRIEARAWTAFLENIKNSPSLPLMD